MSDLRDGQIYRWRWADKARDSDNAPYRSYHCKSQIAVVKNGLLIDTFWFMAGSEYAVKPEEVELTFFADQSWEQIPSWKVPYYDREDVADTRHSNHSGAPIYLRPGAQRSQAAILQEIEYREQKAQSEIRSGQRTLERLTEARDMLSAGKIDEVSL